MSITPISLSPAGIASSTSAAASNSTATAGASASDLANQNVFLQLLVAQLKYQDPDNPADGTAFITQLAQFSELSNSTQMVSDLGAIQQELTTPPTAAATATGATTAGTGASGTGSNTNSSPVVTNS